MSDGNPSFSWPIRVYYEDTDGGGVVYHANYLKFMERARSEWLRSLGFEQTELRTVSGVLFVVREVHLKYIKPACYNDMLEVVTHLEKTGRCLLSFKQIIRRGEEVLVEAEIELVSVQAERFEPVAMPESMRKRITKGE